MATDQEHDDGLTEEERAALAEEEDYSEAGEEVENDDGEGAGDETADDDAEGSDAGDEDDPKDGDDAADAGRDDGASDEEGDAAAENAPILVAQPPSDAEAKLKDIADKKEALITQFDEGDITAREYQKELDALAKQEREIERAVERAQLAHDMEQQRLQNEWQSTVNQFLDDNPIYKDNQRLYRALDQEVRDVAGTEAAANWSGARILAEAHKNLVKAFNLPSGKRDQATAPKREKTDPPPSLHNVPAADGQEMTGGKYAALDRLASTNPLAYEEALMQLPEAERNAYLASS